MTGPKEHKVKSLAELPEAIEPPRNGKFVLQPYDLGLQVETARMHERFIAR